MTHVNSGFSVLCLLHTDTNLPTGLSTFSPSSLQSRVLMTKRFNLLKHCSGVPPPVPAVNSSAAPHGLERKGHVPALKSALREALSVPHTTFPLSSRADVCRFWLSGVLTFFPFCTWISSSGGPPSLPPTPPFPPLAPLIGSAIPLPYRSQWEFIIPLPAPVQSGWVHG